MSGFSPAKRSWGCVLMVLADPEGYQEGACLLGAQTLPKTQIMVQEQLYSVKREQIPGLLVLGGNQECGGSC